MRETVEKFLHRKGQERTEYIGADRRVGRMKNWPRAHDRFGPQEQIFDLKQIAKAEHGLQRRHFRVRPQPEDSVETHLFGELSSVDGSLIGSANWDMRSLRLNFELTVQLYNSDLANQLATSTRGALSRSLRRKSTTVGLS